MSTSMAHDGGASRARGQGPRPGRGGLTSEAGDAGMARASLLPDEDGEEASGSCGGRRRSREARGLPRASPAPKIGGEGDRATASPFRASGVHGVDGGGDGEAGSAKRCQN